ncbi:MAG: helix-turn-helix transcriptional regulator [Hamadaea sp.]|nr:helix-turn-helix transcriptional regulator [Hamadaea sp.]
MARAYGRGFRRADQHPTVKHASVTQESLHNSSCACHARLVTDKITDSAVLAALAHPLRRRLMDLLRAYGPATASTLAERTGEAIGNVSHHLRVLGTAGLLEEAPELARDKRERWWRRSSPNLGWSQGDFAADPAAATVSAAVQTMLLDRHAGAAREWLAAEHPAEDAEWVDAAFIADRWMLLTPAELAQVGQEIIEVLLRWGMREVPDDGHHRDPVLVFSYGVPAQP